MSEQRTEQADTILNELDELLNIIPDETVSNIQNKLEDLRHKIKVETLSEEDMKIMTASNLAAEVYHTITKLEAYIENKGLTEYTSTIQTEQTRKYFDNLACHLDDLARGAC